MKKIEVTEATHKRLKEIRDEANKDLHPFDRHNSVTYNKIIWDLLNDL